MKFLKMHGTGNDFVLVDDRQPRSLDWPELSKRVCDRHFGVGADGVLLVRGSTRADFRMVMYNPDGSEAEMCGNGIRCFAKYLFDAGELKSTTVTIETGAGIKPLELIVEAGTARRVVVNMGAPSFDPRGIPVKVAGPEMRNYPLEVAGRELLLNGVSMGNPHAVHFSDEDIDDFPLEAIGPLVEHDPLFPRRVNFEIARIRSAGQIDVRVWERGAGITLACGTGACAVFAAARRQELVGERAVLTLPGGHLEMREGTNGQIYMTGPAALVFAGEWPED
jgi:diaminopimelate epimerase